MQGDFRIVRCPQCRSEVGVPASDFAKPVSCAECGRSLRSEKPREFKAPRIPEYEEE